MVACPQLTMRSLQPILDVLSSSKGQFQGNAVVATITSRGVIECGVVLLLLLLLLWHRRGLYLSGSGPVLRLQESSVPAMNKIVIRSNKGVSNEGDVDKPLVRITS